MILSSPACIPLVTVLELSLPGQTTLIPEVVTINYPVNSLSAYSKQNEPLLCTASCKAQISITAYSLTLLACGQPRPILSCSPVTPPYSFTINLGQGQDKLNLHFNPRFNESTIVCNTRDGSSWGQEQRESHMCFSPGSEVKVRSNRSPNMALLPGHGSTTRHPQVLLIFSLPLQFTVAFHNDEFKVTLPDGHTVTFPNRLGHNHLRYLGMDGLHISSFKLE